ncbi:MAG: spore coat protein U domain-containing protein [Betaproteobacteria bacterium]|nr:MAG: spore coat protein U domain-containing protein [Betaproteobacteria bacterium]
MKSIRLSKRATTVALASLFSVGAAVVGPAHAGSTPANLAVSASVAANCTISTSAVAFGPYDPIVTNATSALNGSGSVTIACTKGSAPSITLDLGANPAGSQRNMLVVGGGTDVLPYQLYQPPSTTPSTACTFPGSQVWGTNGSAIFTPTAPTTKSGRTYNVCGTVAAGQDVSVGTYQDTVVATVNF